MKILNLGAGNHIHDKAINHDRLKHRPEIDVVHDLNVLPWPWKDNSFAQVCASSVFEHLDIDLLTTLNEVWRILRPGGTLRVKVPHWQHDNAYADPTHRRPYSLRSFDAVVPTTKLGQEDMFYTPRKWEYLKPPKLNEQKSSVIATLRVCK
jgi:ubiquinone/menaquinone biosynthesis C-methylase UbiE